MGSLAVNAFYKPASMLHILFDNRCHESTGAQYTVSPCVDFIRLALACGYPKALFAGSPEALEKAAKTWSGQGGLVFVYCPVDLRLSKDLVRPAIKPPDAAQRFINFIQNKSQGV
jgi:phosphonopyruvate decarboxylase